MPLDQFDETKQQTVGADGTLTIEFRPDFTSNWVVEQVTAEMATAPSGSQLDIRKDGALVAPAASSRRAALSGEPPIPLRPGERLQVAWTSCTPGDTGIAYILYRKVAFE